MEDHLVPVVMFVMVGVVLCTYFYLRFRARQELLSTVRHAAEHGQALGPELLAALGSDAAGGAPDLRRGVIAMALAVALAVFAWFIDTRELLGIAAFPLMLGIAYLGLWRFAPSRSA